MRWALIVLLVCGAGAALAASPPRQTSPAEQDKTSGELANSLDRIATALQNQAESVEPNQPCEKGGDKSRSDLCAQWKAAEAAEKGANAAWLFGLLGALIGAATLIAAIAAARYARSAAYAAMQSVRSTEKGLRQLERQSRRELRAYISISKAWVTYAGLSGPPTAHFEIVNSGQTPAYDVAVHATLYVRPNQPPETRNDLSKRPRTVIGSGLPFPVQINWPDDVQFEAKRTDKIFVRGELRYTDIFKQRWSLHFALESLGTMGSTTMIASATGNREQRFKG